MFTSPSKTIEDNESDGQEEVTASTRPIRTTDAPMDETTKRPRRHSSNSSQDELRKKSRIESPGNIVEEEEESDFSDEEVSLHVFANAPEWARAIMSYLRRSTQKLNASNSALNAKLTKLNEDFEDFKKGKDQEIQHITTSLDFIHSNKTNDLILNLTPENVTQHSRIATTTRKGSSTPTKMSKIIGRQIH